MTTTALTGVIIHLRGGDNVVTISQLTAQVVQEAAFRGVSTTEVRGIVFGLEKAKLICRSTEDGITRFAWSWASPRGRR